MKISRMISFLLIAFYVFLIFYLKPWEAFGAGASIQDMLLAGLAALTLGGLIASGLGMILGKGASKKWFRIFNGIYFLFGCYLTHFYWTFWLFKEPTLADRIRDSAPYFLLGVLLPVILIFLSLKKNWPDDEKGEGLHQIGL